MSLTEPYLVYVIVDRTTCVVTGPYLTVEPGSNQERANTSGSVEQNNVWYDCPWCLQQVVELEDGLEHQCREFQCRQ